MPEQFLSAYLGKFCTFSLGAGLEEVGIVGELMALDGDWIKVRDGENERLLNTRRLTSIRLLPEKYQEKYRRKQNR